MLRAAVLASILFATGCAATLPQPQRVGPRLNANPSVVAPSLQADGTPIVASHDNDATSTDEDVDEVQEALPRATSLGRWSRVKPTANPILGLATPALEDRYRTDPASLGSVSVGQPLAGGLVNGAQLPEGEGWDGSTRPTPTEPGNG